MKIGQVGFKGNDVALRVTPAPQFPSHVQEHEVPDAIELINKQFIELTGKPFEFKTCGYLVCLKIYIRPEELKKIKRADGSEATLWRADITGVNDKYQSITALVVGIGPDAYKATNADGTPRYPTPWCRIGDWVTIPRYESHLFMYRGVALGILPDDRIMGVVNDPTDVTPIHQSDQF